VQVRGECEGTAVGGGGQRDCYRGLWLSKDFGFCL
jgi:hypothetical protein